jgi:hypothetical protein
MLDTILPARLDTVLDVKRFVRAAGHMACRS